MCKAAGRCDEFRAVMMRADRPRILARDDRRPTWRTDRRRADRIGVARAALRKGIQIRRHRVVVAVAAKMQADVFAGDEDDIGTFCHVV